VQVTRADVQPWRNRGKQLIEPKEQARTARSPPEGWEKRILRLSNQKAINVESRAYMKGCKQGDGKGGTADFGYVEMDRKRLGR